MSESVFDVQADYEVPLLRLLADLPDGQGRMQDVLDEFWRRHRNRIPPKHLEKMESMDELHWRNKTQWARQELFWLGLIDSPKRGTWRITQKGRDWLASNPTATRVTGALPRAVPSKTRTSVQNDRGLVAAAPAGISMEVLEQTRKYMPQDEFRRAWGELYDRLLAAERAKAITPLGDRDLLARVREPVRRIQDFLQGRGNDAPKSEEICDWIHFCYLLGLFREGAALWQFVHQDGVNDWQYERTKRLAAVCRSKVGL